MGHHPPLRRRLSVIQPIKHPWIRFQNAMFNLPILSHLLH